MSQPDEPEANPDWCSGCGFLWWGNDRHFAGCTGEDVVISPAPDLRTPADTIAEQAARIERLEAALRPFAQLKAKAEDWPDATIVIRWVDNDDGIRRSFTVGDVRRAAALTEDTP